MSEHPTRISDELHKFAESFQSKHNFPSGIYKTDARIGLENMPSYITQLEETNKILVDPTSNIQHPTPNIQHPTRLLDDWDCDFRFPVWVFHKPTRKWHRKVGCSNPVTREIWKTSEIDIEKCKRCHDTGGSTKSLALPEPKKPKSKPVIKQEPSSVEGVDWRKCLNPYCDKHSYKGQVKRFSDWLPRLCRECGWWKTHDLLKNGKGEYLRRLLGGTISPDRSSEAKDEAQHIGGIIRGTIF